MKITRRSFLKAVGGLAAVATLPSNTPADLPVIPVQTATASTVATQKIVTQVSKVVKPRISLMFNPTVFINDKRLPAHGIACRLDYRHSKWIEYNPDCELTINAEVYGDAAKTPVFDDSWRTPIHVKICLSDVTYEGKGAVVEYSEIRNSFERTFYMIIPMWDVFAIIKKNGIVNRNLS